MTKDEKRDKVEAIYKEQLSYFKKTLAAAKLPEPKRPITSIKRAFRVTAYAIHVRQLEVQKQMIIATPTDVNFECGGVAIVGEKEPEQIINKGGKSINFITPNTQILSSEPQKQACNLCGVINCTDLEPDFVEALNQLINTQIKPTKKRF